MLKPDTRVVTLKSFTVEGGDMQLIKDTHGQIEEHVTGDMYNVELLPKSSYDGYVCLMELGNHFEPLYLLKELLSSENNIEKIDELKGATLDGEYIDDPNDEYETILDSIKCNDTSMSSIHEVFGDKLMEEFIDSINEVFQDFLDRAKEREKAFLDSYEIKRK